MDKKTKLLISEFVHFIEGLDHNDINNLFHRQEYKKLKSFTNDNDLHTLKEYTEFVLGVNLKELKTNNNHPETYLSLLITDQSLSSIGNIIRVPYYQFMDIDKEVDKALSKNNINNDNIIKQFNSVINNISRHNHSVDFLYYIYIDDSEKLTPVFEFDFKDIETEHNLLYSKYLDSLIVNSFDKDVIKKIKSIKEKIINE